MNLYVLLAVAEATAPAQPAGERKERKEGRT